MDEADSRVWLAALERMLALAPRAAIPGHGELSRAPARVIALTRDYLTFLRRVMGEAVAELTSFDEAHGKIDWRAFDKYPAFAQANRLNAYGTYLLMERESLQDRQISAAPPP